MYQSLLGRIGIMKPKRQNQPIRAAAVAVLVVQGLSLALNGVRPGLAASPQNLGQKAQSAGTTQTLASLQYVPPDRGMPRQTRGTGARGGFFEYIPPNRGVPQQTRGTGSRGSFFEYIPPDRGTPTSTQGTGSRGVDDARSLTLDLLVPTDHIGQTTSSHPTFFWRLSSPTSMVMEFALVEPGVSRPLWVQQIPAQTSGIVQLTLPQNLPALEVGKSYRWSVSLIANPKRRSNDIFVQSWIKRISLSESQTQQLQGLHSQYDQAKLYARLGIWYDALTAISAAHQADPSNATIAADRLALLSQAGQNQVVDAETAVAK